MRFPTFLLYSIIIFTGLYFLFNYIIRYEISLALVIIVFIGTLILYPVIHSKTWRKQQCFS